jgi:hypothetical protein
MGWLAWRDENYVVGREIDGEYRKGQAAKWEATDYLRSLVEDGVEEVRGEELSEEEKGEGHIYGQSTIRFQPSTIPEYLRDEIQYWRSPIFVGYVGQMTRTAA